MTFVAAEISPAIDSYTTAVPEILSYPATGEVLEEYGLDALPQGIAIIGGAARAIAVNVLFGEERAPVRDIDLVGIRECEPDTSLYDALSEEYMPDDARFGHGVRSESMTDYFLTRDFTMNEVMVVNGQLLLTSQCYADLRDAVIRFSDGEIDEDGRVSSKLYYKALLMECVFQEYFGRGRFISDGVSIDRQSDFHFALALNKAFQYGPEVTARFLGFDPDTDLTVAEAEAINEAIALGQDTGFIFRGSDAADRVNLGDEHPWGDMPPALDDRTEEAIELMRAYSGRWPQGADGYE